MSEKHNVNTPNTLCYARNSSGLSGRNYVDAQIELFKRYEQNNDRGVVIKEIFREDSVSAFRDSVRPEYERMVEKAIEDPDVEFILFVSHDRFCRNLFASRREKERIRGNGLKIIFINEPNLDSESPDGILMESFLENMAYRESYNTKNRTFLAMRENAFKRDPETGWCFKNGGKIPFGYRAEYRIGIKGCHDVFFEGEIKYDERKHARKPLWFPDEKIAPHWRQCYVMLASDDSVTYQDCCDYLNKQGILTPEGKNWDMAKFKDKITNVVYKGWFVWGKMMKPINWYNDREPHKDEDIVVIKDAHPAIVEPELFDKVAKRFKTIQKAKGTRTAKSPWLLSGLLVCPKCGDKMVAGSRDMYACRAYWNDKKNKIRCDNTTQVKKGIVEKILTEHFIEVFSDQTALKDLIFMTSESLKGQKEGRHDEIKDVENKIRALSKKIDRYENDMIAEDDALVRQRARATLKEMLYEQKKLEKMLNSMKKVIPVTGDIGLKLLEENISMLIRAFESGDSRIKKRILELLIDKVVYFPDREEIEIHEYSLLYAVKGLSDSERRRLLKNDFVSNQDCDSSVSKDIKPRVIVKKVSSAKESKKRQERIDRGGLDTAKKYQELLNSPEVTSKADLARKLGVSRARVTQVLKRLK